MDLIHWGSHPVEFQRDAIAQSRDPVCKEINKKIPDGAGMNTLFTASLFKILLCTSAGECFMAAIQRKVIINDLLSGLIMRSILMGGGGGGGGIYMPTWDPRWDSSGSRGVTDGL